MDLAKIQLLSVQYPNVELFAISSERNITDNSKLDLKFATLKDENENLFIIHFEIILQKENDFKLKVVAFAHFSSSNLVSDEFLNSHFCKINAPAIAFPYLRAYVSNFILNSGYNPIFLPAINFVSVAKIKEKMMVDQKVHEEVKLNKPD